MARRNRNRLIWMSLIGIAACVAGMFIIPEKRYLCWLGLVGSVGSLGVGIKTRLR